MSNIGGFKFGDLHFPQNRQITELNLAKVSHCRVDLASFPGSTLCASTEKRVLAQRVEPGNEATVDSLYVVTC